MNPKNFLDQLHGIRSQGLLNSSQMLLPLSHWTHGRGVEASLLIAAQAKGLGQFQLLFSLSQTVTVITFTGNIISEITQQNMSEELQHGI